jgi:uncharacterized protein
VRARPEAAARAALVVIAKAPAPGRSKTRLCPPCSPIQAAELAAAALRDTLGAVAAVAGSRRRLLVLDGCGDGWEPLGFEVHRQRAGGLANRLAGAFAAAAGPALLVGMDTPQLSEADLERGLRALEGEGADAVLGPACDGGYWAIGLRRPDERAFRGVPMSTPETGGRQEQRLRELGLRVARLPPLRDVDTIDDAYAVAAERPDSRFARTLEGLALGGASTR